jgi:hypothetical protein
VDISSQQASVGGPRGSEGSAPSGCPFRWTTPPSVGRVTAVKSPSFTAAFFYKEAVRKQRPRHSIRMADRRNRAHSFPADVSGRLSEFDGRDGPVPFVSSDRDAQAMYFVEPNALNRTSFAVGKDHALADKLNLGSLELAEDRACAFFHCSHDGVPQTGEA